MTLRDEVDKFRAWDAAYPSVERSGEWECDYSNWGELHASVVSFLETVPSSKWNSEEISDLLYALARDNEIEHLARAAAKDRNGLLTLARAALASPERNAKWQLAARLGEMSPPVLEAEALLMKFAHDHDEYVSRRALLSLGAMKSKNAEALAERAWNTGGEYQRMAALSVIKDVAPDRLSEYITKALADGRQYLVHQAHKLQQA